MTAALDATDAGTCAVCEAPGAVREHLFTKDGHAIARCTACGLVARAELPARGDLDELYGAAYFEATAGNGVPGSTGYLAYVGDEEFHRATARRRLDRLAANPGERLLDVGAAAGFFVDEARGRGLDARGLDVAPSMVQWGRDRLGVPLRQGTLQEDDGAAGSLDVVTMWDYLEHAIDPAGDLRAAARLLAPDGRLVLSTGDAGAALARVSLRRWHLMTPRHHNFFFSRDTLRLLLGRTGFRVREIRARGGTYPLRYVLHRAGVLDRPGLAARLPAAVAASRAGAVGLPLNLFDIVTVEATRSAAGVRA